MLSGFRSAYLKIQVVRCYCVTGRVRPQPAHAGVRKLGWCWYCILAIAGCYPTSPEYDCDVSRSGAVGSGGSEEKLVIPRGTVCVLESGLWGYLGAQGVLDSVRWLHRVQGMEMGTALSVCSAGSILGWNADTCTRILGVFGRFNTFGSKRQGTNQRTHHGGLPARDLPAVCTH